LVDDVLEVAEVTDADAGEGVGVAGKSEGFDDLGEVGDRGVDVVDLGTGCEAQFDERLDLLAGYAVVQEDGVTADEAHLFQSVDPALGGGRREPDKSAHLARRAPSVLQESVDDAAVGWIERWESHVQSVTLIGSWTF
jgi:hypothetical protein